MFSSSFKKVFSIMWEYGGCGKVVHPNEAIVSLVLMLLSSGIVMQKKDIIKW